MAKEQLSITVPKELADRAQAMVAAGEARSLSAYLSGALAHQLDADERRIRSHALVDGIFGLAPNADADESAARAVAVIHAQADALVWVRDTTGRYPAPRPGFIAAAAAKLRADDDRDPVIVLRGVAADALAVYRAAA